VPIGRPIANTQVFVVDGLMEPVPVGVAGELCIGGRNLARGYLNRAELTAERFVEHPFDSSPGARVYRTGDLVRFRGDGVIDYLGRLDHQVKLRGFRVELGEIEQALLSVDGVDGAVVVARDVGGDTRLVGYVSGVGVPAVGELIGFLRGVLPDYMVPGVFVELDGIPLSPNGKVDRGALPEPGVVRPDLGVVFEAPVGGLESVIAGVWADLIGVERVGVNDNFFDLGGHSLLLVEARSRLQERLDREIPLVEFFQFPTVRSLASHLDDASTDEDRLTGARQRAQHRRAALASRRERHIERTHITQSREESTDAIH